jgi:hypothetical protein
MDYKITTIPPAGRHKYGNYLSAGNISKMIVTYDNNGNGTSGGGNTGGGNQDEQPIQKNYALVLSKTTNNFEWDDVVANNGVTDIVKPIGYGDLEMIPVFVGDISIAPKDENDVASKRNYDIKGLESGITISVKENGTSATTIEVKIDESFEGTQGTLYFPCSIYSGPENQAPYLPSYDANGNLIDDIDTASDYSDWHMARENCRTLWLEYNFNITIPVTNHYTMEITNELAAVNCDASGNIISNVDVIHCQATMYLGSAEVEGAVYSLTLPTDKEVIGVTIDTQTGELTFGSNFSFKGSQLEIKIKATKDKTTIYKIMSIVKQYPGADGTPAVIRWVVPSVNVIKFNPNTSTLTPSKISCKVMKQEGENTPVEDTTTKIYYGYDTTNPITQYTSEIAIDVSKSYIAFALKNSEGKIYEMETISIMRDGVNGQNGKDGQDGKDGTNGESVYRLTLTNENASINADYFGNIYADAQRPTCTATLYHGATKVPNATYSMTSNPATTGVSINSTTGVLTFGSNFYFDGKSVEITITSKIGDIIYGTAIMTISKSLAGKNGEDGQDGKDGVDGTDGIDGQNGISIVWKGSSISAPANPQNGWAYYNTGQKKSFVYQDGSWYQMTIDGIDGQNGKDGTNGLSIVWKGESATAPSNPQINWCYKDTDNGKVYIYNGTGWELMVLDGSDGEDGADGSDGLSVFITYHDNAITSKPNKPTGNGTTNGWHTNATSTANWMSQKVAASASEGTWGDPIQICGADGADGTDGSDGQDGADGADAVSYWLDLSTTEVVVTKGATTATPSSVTIKAYKQIGGDTPIDITSQGVIKWGYNTSSPQNTATTITNINTAQTYVMVHLIVGGTIYDRQTISILKDGKDGADGSDGADGKDGAQGRQGAAIRGPIDWKNVTTSRRWCNGVLTNASYPEDAEFIDIVVFNGTYYKCKTSYNGKGSETTAPSSTYWTQVDNSYAFVAANLLLANNAKIKFATSNELYLMDNSGNVTAGAAGGNGTSFWAGANEPTNANFKVDYNGNITAKSGTFAGYVQMPYVRTSTLETGYSSYYGTYVLPKSNAYLLVDSGFYGMGDGCFIKIPEPTAALNGFTYHIIAKSNIATKSSAGGYYGVSKDGFNHSVTIETINKSQKLIQNVFYRDGAAKYHTLAFYSGTIVLTCLPSFSDEYEYVWCVTQCEDVDCYISDDLSAVYSKVYSDNSVEKIMCVRSVPTNQYADSHVLYVINPNMIL